MGLKRLDQSCFARLFEIHQVGTARLLLRYRSDKLPPGGIVRAERSRLSGFEFDAVIARRIVRSGDHHPADGVQISHSV